MTIASSDHPLAECIADLDGPEVLALVEARIGQAEDPGVLLAECRQGLEEVGRRFETGEYFIADLMYAASIFKDVMSILGPEIKKGAATSAAGRVAIATVKDDIHDVGKNLVAAMLDAAGFEVFDLGVDVSAQTICDSIKEHNPDILALSCLLTTTVDSMEAIIAEINRVGLRSKVKIIVGGIPVSPEVAVAIGADAYGDNAHEAVLRCKELVEVRR